MDYAVKFADDYFLDSFYAKLFPLHPGNTTSVPLTSFGRDNDLRLCITIFFITMLGGYLFYLSCSTITYFFVFDKVLMKHPRFLKNQIWLEIKCACQAIPGFTILTVPWFWGEVKGYSKLYEDPAEYGYAYMAFSVLLFLFFTDFGIYWIHRYEHHPRIYKHVHKLHHKWIVPTPFASHAFAAIDGYAQSVPYHLFAYLFPLQKHLYLALFIAVNIWTVSIHDSLYIDRLGIVNSSAHHAVHHLYFNYNYGQYFTLWDRIGGTHRSPTDEQYLKKLRHDQTIWTQQTKESTKIEAESDAAKPKTS